MINTDIKEKDQAVPKTYTTSLLIIGSLFFVFGFVTWLSSVLIPYLQIACELTVSQSYLVAFAFYISYFIMAIPSSWVLKVTGFKKGMSAGLILLAIGCLIFIPAAIYREYSIFLLGLFFQGSGLTLLQTASNPYVAILGPKESAASRMCIMGVCNGVAGILAPLLLGAIILVNIDPIKAQLLIVDEMEKSAVLDALSKQVILPYIAITVSLLLMAVLINRSSLPEIDDSLLVDDTLYAEDQDVNQKSSIFQFPHLLFGVLALFVYTGVEVIAANSIIGFGTYLDIPMHTAKFFSSFTLFGMLLGFLIGIIFIPRFFSQRMALKVCAGLGIVFGLGAILTNGIVSIVFVALLGLANSLIGAAIWPLALSGLGKFTKTGAALLVMAISGAAVIPLLFGWLTDYFDARQAYWLVIPCYLIIAWYAVYGYKSGNFTIKNKV